VGHAVSDTPEAEAGETVIFSFSVYKSKRDRDRVKAAVMKDDRLQCMMDPEKKKCRST